MAAKGMAKVRLVHGLKMLNIGVETLLHAYEEYPELNDQVDISQIVPGSLDEWSSDIDAKIYMIVNEEE
jgi:hypothetical protein